MPSSISIFSSDLVEIEDYSSRPKATIMSIPKLVRIRPVAAVIAAAAAVLLTGCVGGAATAPGGAGTTTLHLVGYAVPKEANNAIEKKFAETPEGQGVVGGGRYG